MTTTLEPTDVIAPNPRATYRRLEDGSGGVLLHLDTAAYHGVNEMGAEIWTLLEPGITVGELLTQLRDRLADPPTDFEEEVRSFLAGLVERDLIVVGEAPAG